jgi:hypothetical protein
MRKREEDREKVRKMLESVKSPELSNKEIENNKNELQRFIADRFHEITAEREKKKIISRKFYYSLASVSLVVVLLVVGLLVIKPFMNREAVVRIIKNKLSIEVNREDILIKNGEGIVINDNREIVVNIASGEYKTYSPVSYEPSLEEKNEAIQIVRNSSEAKSFVIKEGEAPEDVSENPVILVQGLEFPNSGIKYIEVSLKYTPLIQPPQGYISMSHVDFTVDIAKGKVVGAK